MVTTTQTPSIAALARANGIGERVMYRRLSAGCPRDLAGSLAWAAENVQRPRRHQQPAIDPECVLIQDFVRDFELLDPNSVGQAMFMLAVRLCDRLPRECFGIIAEEISNTVIEDRTAGEIVRRAVARLEARQGDSQEQEPEHPAANAARVAPVAAMIPLEPFSPDRTKPKRTKRRGTGTPRLN